MGPAADCQLIILELQCFRPPFVSGSIHRELAGRLMTIARQVMVASDGRNTQGVDTLTAGAILSMRPRVGTRTRRCPHCQRIGLRDFWPVPPSGVARSETDFSLNAGQMGSTRRRRAPPPRLRRAEE